MQQYFGGVQCLVWADEPMTLMLTTRYVKLQAATKLPNIWSDNAIPTCSSFQVSNLFFMELGVLILSVAFAVCLAAVFVPVLFTGSQPSLGEGRSEVLDMGRGRRGRYVGYGMEE